MAVIIARGGLSLRDARGKVGKVGWYYQYDNSTAQYGDNAISANQNLAAAVAACSNGGVINWTGLAAKDFLPNGYGTTSQYQNVEDKARLVFLFAGTGATPEIQLVHLDIPAPKVALFFADLATINPANANIVTLTTQYSAIDATGGRFTTKAGLVYVQLVGGYRVRRKAQRKITLWWKSPNLDEPEE